MKLATVMLVSVVLFACLSSAKAAKLQPPKIDYGTDKLVANRTVYSALTISDGKSIAAHLHQKGEHGVHAGNHTQLESDVIAILKVRSKNREALVASLNFETFQWPMINTHACPHYPHSGHARTERGFGLSHMQIWLEFYFFDHDIIDAMHRKVPEYITSNSYSSVSGVFSSVQNGSIYKNGIPFLDEDITLVFEDTAMWAPHSTSASDNNSSSINANTDHNLASLGAALASMKTDILSLGTGRSPARIRTPHARRTLEEAPHPGPAPPVSTPLETAAATDTAAGAAPTPTEAAVASALRVKTYSLFTANAYAITRQGARRMTACFDHCGPPLEEQVRRCAEAGLVTIAQLSPPLFDTVVDPV